MKTKVNLKILGIFLIFLSSCHKESNPDEIKVVLPEKLIITPDKYVEEMDAVTGWGKNDGTTLEVNTSDFHSGTASLKVTSAVGANAILEKNVSWDCSADSGKSFKLWVNPQSDPVSTISGITVYAHNDDWSNVFRFSFPSTSLSLKQNEWTLIWLDPGCVPGGWVKEAGDPDWSKINKIKIVVATKAGQQSVCSFDLMSEGMVRKPCVIISFDDNNSNRYSKAFPLFKAKNMVATCYVISDEIDGFDNMTSAELQEMYDYGFDIANHTKSHAVLTSLTKDQIISELSGCQTALDNLGLTRASKHVAYPGGYYNDVVLDAMKTWGAKTGRTVNGYGYTMYEKGVYFLGFPYKLNSVGPIGTGALEETKKRIDKCISLNISCNIYLHGIVDENPTSDQWTTAELSELLNYIESKKLQTLTVEEFYRLNTGMLSVSHK